MIADDPEPAAMAAVSRILAELPDAESRRRVISWVADRCGVVLGTSRERTSSERTESVLTPAQPAEQPFDLFAELFDAVRPATEQEKALAAAYWKCRVDREPQFMSQEINRLLTDLGHKVGNITEALSASIRDKPSLILQLRKSGSSRQARKSYKISEAGARWIEGRLRGDIE